MSAPEVLYYQPEIGVIVDGLDGAQVAALSPRDRGYLGPLFAAAPDLLACVRDALKYVDEDEMGNPVDEAVCSPGYAAHLRALKAAIRKAEGR